LGAGREALLVKEQTEIGAERSAEVILAQPDPARRFA
jgi:hypothetical protein